MRAIKDGLWNADQDLALEIRIRGKESGRGQRAPDRQLDPALGVIADRLFQTVEQFTDEGESAC